MVLEKKIKFWNALTFSEREKYLLYFFKNNMFDCLKQNWNFFSNSSFAGLEYWICLGKYNAWECFNQTLVKKQKLTQQKGVTKLVKS